MLRGCPARCPRPPGRRGCRADPRSRTVVPAGVWTSALPVSARAICWMRSSSACAHASSSRSRRACGPRRRPGRSPPPPDARLGGTDLSPRSGSARVHPRKGRQIGGGFVVGRPGCASSRGTPSVSSSRSSSSSSSGSPRSRTAAFAARAGVGDELLPRAVELGGWAASVERRGQRPTSSRSLSTTGWSNAPSAIVGGALQTASRGRTRCDRETEDERSAAQGVASSRRRLTAPPSRAGRRASSTTSSPPGNWGRRPPQLRPSCRTRASCCRSSPPRARSGRFPSRASHRGEESASEGGVRFSGVRRPRAPRPRVRG
jgi:hypothetical protein